MGLAEGFRAQSTVTRAAPSVGSVAPIARASTLVSDGQDSQTSITSDVCEVVREPLDLHPPNLQDLINSINQGAGKWPTRNAIDRPVDRCEKDQTKPMPLSFVPTRRVPEFSDRLVEKTNLRRHSVRASDSRCRTAIQFWLVASPARAR